MCRTSPLVARKCKFAMKLVKNCIKTCPFCNDYQSILSDVDKHQRSCDQNPNKHQTLAIDDEDDEHKFLSHFQNDLNDTVESERKEDHEPINKATDESIAAEGRPFRHKNLDSSAFQYSTGGPSEDLRLGKMHSEDQKRRFKSKSKGSTKIDRSNILQKYHSEKDNNSIGPIEDNLRILPHLHKHDLHKMTVYDKPNYWI